MKENSFDNVNQAIRSWWQENHQVGFDPKNPVVRLHEPTFGPEEIEVFTQLMLQTKVTMGECVTQFERDYCDLMGFSHGVSNNSGSSANLLMMTALTNSQYSNPLKKGDEVIIPALTWSTSLWPIVQCGLIPCFVDSDIKTLNIDRDAIIAAISPKTRAIMCVPIYGNPCDYDMLLDICKEYDLLLIEDSCESMGATFKNKYVGSFGVVSSFSFYYSHHITTLEGGICVTDDAELSDLMRIIRSHGWVRNVENKKKWQELYPDFDQKFLFVNEGYNLRLTEPQAAMGSIQIKKLSSFVEARQKNAMFFRNAFSKYEEYFTFQEETVGGNHAWFGFIFILKDSVDFSANQICSFLNKHGIETRSIVAGNLTKHPGVKLFDHKVSGDLANADHIMNNGFSIAAHQSLDDSAKEYVVEIMERFFKAKV